MSRRKDAVRLRSPVGAPVDLITLEAARTRGSDQPGWGANYMASLAINLRNLDRLQVVLCANGVMFRIDNQVVVVEQDQACGTDLAFQEAGVA